MKKLLIITLFIFTKTLCAKNTKVNAHNEEALVIIEVLDYENKGESSDIYLKYNFVNVDASVVKDLRVFISASSDLEVDNLLKVKKTNYYSIPIIDPTKGIMLGENLKTIEGELITEGVDYTVCVLSILENKKKPIKSNLKSITINNEIIVTTPQIKGDFKAQEDLIITDDGTLYINEGHKGNKLFKVSSDGISHVVNDNMEGPVGIAINKEGEIYTSCFGNNVIKKVTTKSGEVTNFITDVNLKGGGGLIFDNEGNLFNTFSSLFLEIPHKKAV